MIKKKTTDKKTTISNKVPIKENFDRFVDKMTMFLGKIGNQRHLSVLRDSFATFLPFLIVGALGMLFITIIFGGWDSSQNSLIGLISLADTGSTDLTGNYASASEWATRLFEILPASTIDCISVYIVIFIGFYLTKSRTKDGEDFFGNALVGVALSLFAFLAITRLDTGWFGARGLLPAILVTMLVVELYMWLQTIKKLAITMPSSVPPAVGRSFTKLIPIILTAGALALTDYLFVVISDVSNWDIISNGVATVDINDLDQSLNIVQGMDLSTLTPDQLAAIYSGMDIDPSVISHVRLSSEGSVIVAEFKQVDYAGGTYGIVGTIYQIFTAPIMAIVANDNAGLAIAIFYVLLVGFFWFLGLHGANMMDGIFLPIWLSALAFNVADIQAGNEPTYIFAQPFFEGFIWIGGGMGTIMLIVGTLIFSRRVEEREVAKFAIVPGVFNINEPVVFGFPLVLNWRYFVPIVFTMPIMVVVTWLFMGPLNIVSLPTISMPWTTPPILGSLIVTRFDWKAIIPTFINLGIMFSMYLPFILMGNKDLPKIEKNKNKTSQKTK